MKLSILFIFLISISCGKNKNSQDFSTQKAPIELFQLKSNGSFNFKRDNHFFFENKKFNFDKVFFQQSLLKNFKLLQNKNAKNLAYTPYQEVLHCFTKNERAAFKAMLQSPYMNEFEGHINLDTQIRNLFSHSGFSVEKEKLFLVNLNTLEKVFLQKNTWNFLKFNDSFFNNPICLVLRLEKFIVNSKNTSFVYQFTKDNLFIPKNKEAVTISFLEQFYFTSQKINFSFDKDEFIYPKEALTIEGKFERKAILPKKKNIKKVVPYEFLGSARKSKCVGTYTYEGEGVEYVPATKKEEIFLAINEKRYAAIASAFDYREYQIYLDATERAIKTKEIKFVSDLMIEVTEKLTFKSKNFGPCPKEKINKILVPVFYQLKNGKALKHFLP